MAGATTTRSAAARARCGGWAKPRPTGSSGPARRRGPKRSPLRRTEWPPWVRTGHDVHARRPPAGGRPRSPCRRRCLRTRPARHRVRRIAPDLTSSLAPRSRAAAHGPIRRPAVVLDGHDCRPRRPVRVGGDHELRPIGLGQVRLGSSTSVTTALVRGPRRQRRRHSSSASCSSGPTRVVALPAATSSNAIDSGLPDTEVTWAGPRGRALAQAVVVRVHLAGPGAPRPPG